MKDIILVQVTFRCFEGRKTLFISSYRNFSRHSHLPLSFQQTLPSEGRRLVVVSELS